MHGPFRPASARPSGPRRPATCPPESGASSGTQWSRPATAETLDLPAVVGPAQRHRVGRPGQGQERRGLLRPTWRRPGGPARPRCRWSAPRRSRPRSPRDTASPPRAAPRSPPPAPPAPAGPPAPRRSAWVSSVPPGQQVADVVHQPGHRQLVVTRVEVLAAAPPSAGRGRAARRGTPGPSGRSGARRRAPRRSRRRSGRSAALIGHSHAAAILHPVIVPPCGYGDAPCPGPRRRAARGPRRWSRSAGAWATTGARWSRSQPGGPPGGRDRHDRARRLRRHLVGGAVPPPLRLARHRGPAPPARPPPHPRRDPADPAEPAAHGRPVEAGSPPSCASRSARPSS